jgi:uncharacterized membrane protein
MIPSLKQMIIAAILFVLVDLPWLLTAGQYALRMTERIQGSPVILQYGPALVVYIAVAYLVYQVNTVQEAALLGAATYAVYDFTSLTVLKKYEWQIAVADSLWGGALFAIVFTLLKRFDVF